MSYFGNAPQNHFEPGLVQPPDHFFEFLDGFLRQRCRRIGGLRCEVRKGTVSPIVRKPLANEVMVVDEMMGRHQFLLTVGPS